MKIGMIKYLEATPTINFNNSALSQKAKDVTENANSDLEKSVRIFYFVRDKIKYNPYLFSDCKEDFRAARILLRGEGFCVHKAIVLTALARACGIPARLGFADIRNHIISGKLTLIHTGNIIPWHGFAELNINGNWVKATPAFDIEMCENNGVIPVEFNGIDDAVFHLKNREGKLHIEYIRYRDTYADMPFDEFRACYISYFGSEYYDKFKKFKKRNKICEINGGG